MKWTRILKTKTFWGGLASVASGVGLIVAGDVPAGLQLIGVGLMAILLRDAVRKVEAGK